MSRSIIITSLMLFGIYAPAQSALDTYLAEGLSNNLVIQQKNISLEKSINALKMANSLFYPNVAVQGNYTSGEGGRSINFPVGDLMNPVYATLNQLTSSNSFPQISNQDIDFFPYNFYDAKVHTTIPIVNTDIYYNRNLQQQQITIQNDEIDIYKKELIRNIRVAYFSYLSAERVTGIYREAILLAEESKRVNESLLKNGKGLPAYVIRSQAEIDKLNAKLNESKLDAENARMYFNFLINRDANLPVDTNYDVQNSLLRVTAISSNTISIDGREELRMMNHAIGMNKTVLRMNRNFWVPKLNGFLDLGSQASNWKFNSQSRYYLVGLQLDFPLFTGFRNRYKIEQSRFDLRQNEISLSLMTRQFELSAAVSRNKLKAAQSNYLASAKEVEAASTYRSLIEKGYQQGINSFLETLDARNQQTQAQILYSINQYKVLIELANYEREINAQK